MKAAASKIPRSSDAQARRRVFRQQGAGTTVGPAICNFLLTRAVINVGSLLVMMSRCGYQYGGAPAVDVRKTWGPAPRWRAYRVPTYRAPLLADCDSQRATITMPARDHGARARGQLASVTNAPTARAITAIATARARWPPPGSSARAAIFSEIAAGAPEPACACARAARPPVKRASHEPCFCSAAGLCRRGGGHGPCFCSAAGLCI